MTVAFRQAQDKRRRGGKALLVVLVFLVGIFVGRYVVPGAEAGVRPLQFVSVKDGERQLVFPTFWEAWDKLHGKFVSDLDDQKLFYGAVEGLVRAAGDPYTVFLDPEQSKAFEESIQGSFSGVGIEIGVRSGLVVVIAPLDGSPAKEAGVQDGDVIVSVDDEPIKPDMTLDDVVKMIRGPKGSQVKLSVIHRDTREQADITITRDTIEVESVKSSVENGVAIIRITNFNSDTSERFTRAAREALAQNVRGVIVDVRGNPGGFLQAAVDIASRFLPRGAVVVSERGKETQEYRAEGNTLFDGLPVVVVADGGSASASEILAGALHDQLQAPIVGEKTFGKGSVQELLSLADGSSLKVTVAKWFTPEGRNINEEGIEPTIEMADDADTDADEQLDRAKEELQKLLGS